MNAKANLYLYLAALSLCLMASFDALAADRPNIVIILADDLGYADLGYRGSNILTPHIDALAKAGVQLEDYYGLPVCTPARAALMTGRYPMRYGLQTLVIFPSHTYGLPTDERTLAQALKDAGYQTAMVGKWHLGHADTKYWPQNRGFDYYYGNLVGEVDYFTHKRGGVIDWQRNGKFLKEEGYHTDLVGNEAVNIINNHNPSKPLFLYVAFLSPHAPYQAQQKYLDMYKNIQDTLRRSYSAMITDMDDQIGKIVDALKEKNMYDNTIIFFTSDNGGPVNSLFASGAMSYQNRGKNPEDPIKGEKLPASNGPLRGGKGSLYEGGVRLPAFITWPGKLKPGVIDVPLDHVDVMPTLLYLAGAKETTGKPLDGLNMWPVLTGKQKTLHDNILINVEAFRGAVRKGNWKLIKNALLPGKIELYDLSKDPGETNNVAEQNPDIVRELDKILNNYAKQQTMSEWLKAQFQFIKVQGKTVLDPDFDVDDSGLPYEKAALPEKESSQASKAK